ncbi:electron transfer flavoprotein subunit alpha/FixB family protein [Sporolactobacillus sp. KGMB 08714]|uniref:electron transfer flavoprotein subunit alpha/FixB family protein n=1 Tax=Sporolactobacillus sp. KGMB 08714 TaxID=3064704 RepID=UPI002FBD8D29
MTIFVFAENNSGYAELCDGASQLNHRVEAVMIGSKIQQVNADKVWHIPDQKDTMLEDYTDTIIALVKKVKPDFFLIESTKRCKLIAGRIAAAGGTSVITDVFELAGNGEAKHAVYGGAAVREEKVNTATAIIMMMPGAFSAGGPPVKKPEVETFEYVEPHSKMKIINKEQKQRINADVSHAKRVIGVGRGLAAREDLDMIRKLASLIGAEIGCSRPIAEVEHWLPKEIYIGVTGVTISPDVYLALGISGQIQHAVGISQAKTIIAINKDKKAPIFEHADYGIVADLYKVVPALIHHFN